MLKEQIMNVIPALKEEEDPRVTAFTVERDDFVQAIMYLANKCGYDALLDLCAVEYPEDMVGVYNLMNFEDMDMIRVSVHIPKDDLWLPSLDSVFKAAYVLELSLIHISEPTRH